MMEGGDWELELVAQLSNYQVSSPATRCSTHANELVKVDRLVAVGVHFHPPAQHLDQRLPLQRLREALSLDLGPSPLYNFLAELVLGNAQLSRLVVRGA